MQGRGTQGGVMEQAHYGGGMGEAHYGDVGEALHYGGYGGYGGGHTTTTPVRLKHSFLATTPV